MSNLRDQLAIFKAEKKRRMVAHQQYQEEEEKLQEIEEDLHLQIIHDEKLLTATSWKYVRSSFPMLDKTFTLESIGGWEYFKPLCELLKPNYHDSYPMAHVMAKFCQGDGEYGEYRHTTVNLQFSDGEIHLDFDSDEIAIAFIAEFGLIVDFEDLERERMGLVAQLTTLDEIIKRVREWRPDLQEERTT